MKIDAGIFSVTALVLLVGGCYEGGGRDEGSIQPPAEEPPPPEEPLPQQPPPAFGDVQGDAPSPVLGAACNAGAGRNAARGGIWAGESQPGEPAEIRLLVAETGEFHLISPYVWDEQIFGTMQTLDHRLTSNDAVWVWWHGLTWLETEFANVGMQGELDEEGNLSLSYETDSDPSSRGTLSLSACNSVYTRGSSLALLSGTYVNGNRMLAIDKQGEVFFQDRSCVGSGSAELIDPDFNMYRMELTVSSCAGNEVHAVGSTFSGLAYLGDSGAGFTGDLLEYSLSSADEHDILIWTDLARK